MQKLCHYCPYLLAVVEEENICDVCLGTAVLYCEQCKNFYCKDCNARRHSRLPSHRFSRISQIPLPKPSAGENIYMHDVVCILNWKVWCTYSKRFIYPPIYWEGSRFSIPDWHSSQKFWLPWAQGLARGGGKGSIGWKECYCHPAHREWQKPLLPATTFCWCGNSSCHLPNTQPDTWPSGGLAPERDSCHFTAVFRVHLANN